ncbi:MAG TPA: trypsin-like peptidase domain-containing protein [Opitutales bacterium]|nr:trypsin-like peptidase domain-containing protein [Opitutales bacterium]
MKKQFTIKGIFICLALTFAACTAEEEQSVDFDLPLDPEPIDRADPTYLTSYAPILKPAKGAVVAVHSASVMRFIRQRGMDPREEMLRRYFGLPPGSGGQPEEFERRYSEGVGSGVLISQDGYILTNNHVVTGRSGEPADEILVELNDGSEYAAQLVGRDPGSDLAVLKIEASDLPFLTMADSDLLEVGDVVFAIGNPMGIGLTITQGIVSATGRSNLSILGETGYESFIQTDAPINPGNSGGALVDAYGRLIGINTAILSRSGGSIGLGFAIPSTFAHEITLDLVREGKVRRGLLGVSIEDLNAEYAQAFNVPEAKGAFIQSVGEGLPAEKAGLRGGDVIVAVNGEPIDGATELRLKIGRSSPGEKVELSVRREGELVRLDVELADPENPFGEGAVTGELLTGVKVATINSDLRMKYGIEEDISGFVVTSVEENSPYASGFLKGMLILEINGTVPRSVAHAQSLMESREVSSFFIYSGGRSGYLSVRPD